MTTDGPSPHPTTTLEFRLHVINKQSCPPVVVGGGTGNMCWYETVSQCQVLAAVLVPLMRSLILR